MSKSSLCFVEHKKLRYKSFLSSKSIQEHSVTQIHPVYFRCFCNNRSPFVYPSNWADAADGWYLRREIQPSKTTQNYHRELTCFGCETRCSMELVSFRESSTARIHTRILSGMHSAWIFPWPSSRIISIHNHQLNWILAQVDRQYTLHVSSNNQHFKIALF